MQPQVQQPLQLILVALASGVAQAVQPVMSRAVQDAYEAFRGYLTRRYPEITLGEVEAQAAAPGASPILATLEEAAQDPEALKRAHALIEACDTCENV